MNLHVLQFQNVEVLVRLSIVSCYHPLRYDQSPMLADGDTSRKTASPALITFYIILHQV
jgi:hypothetical protein